MKKKTILSIITVVCISIGAFFGYKYYKHHHGNGYHHRSRSYKKVDIPLNGIDISHHQKNVDWKVVAQDTCIKFVILKATEGNNLKDTHFKQYRREARKQKLLVGAYHFFCPNRGGKSQFENFRSVVGKDIDIIPVVDLEPSRGKMISKKDYQQKVQNFIDDCKRYYGVKPILYINIHHYKRYVYPIGKDCLKWYGYDGVRFAESMMKSNDTEIAILQFSEKGKVKGIKGNVDLDFCKNIDRIKLK